MCQSKANGGQRCHSHAKTRLESASRKADAAHDAAKALGQDHPGYRAAVDTFHARLTDLYRARAEYASTPQGEADFRRMLETGEGIRPETTPITDAPASQPDPIDLRIALERGKEMRERNQAVRAAVLNATKTHTAAATSENHDHQDPPEGDCAACGQQLYLDTYSYNPSGRVILTDGSEGGSNCPATPNGTGPHHL